jgi:hypothetical protein
VLEMKKMLKRLKKKFEISYKEEYEDDFEEMEYLNVFFSYLEDLQDLDIFKNIKGIEISKDGCYGEFDVNIWLNENNKINIHYCNNEENLDFILTVDSMVMVMHMWSLLKELLQNTDNFEKFIMPENTFFRKCEEYSGIEIINYQEHYDN